MGYKETAERLTQSAIKALGLLLIGIGVESIYISHSFTYLTVIGFRFTNLYYLGYPLSFITFGAFILIFNYKFKAVALPLFVFSYTSWEIFEQGYHILGATEYPFFILLGIVSIPCAIYLSRRTYLRFAVPFFILYWVVWQFAPGDQISEQVIESLWCVVMYKSLELREPKDFIC